MLENVDRLINSILITEALRDGSDFISMSFHVGGLPDLSGSPREFKGMVKAKSKVMMNGEDKKFYLETHPWDTPQTNVKKSYKYRACLLNDDKGLNRTVVFTKSPSTFAEDRRQDKLASYLADEYGYTSQIANEIVVSPAVVNLIASRDCTLGEFKEAKAQWFSNRG